MLCLYHFTESFVVPWVAGELPSSNHGHAALYLCLGKRQYLFLSFFFYSHVFKQLVKRNDFEAALRLQPDKSSHVTPTAFWRFCCLLATTSTAQGCYHNRTLKREAVYSSSVIIIISGNNNACLPIFFVSCARCI